MLKIVKYIKFIFIYISLVSGNIIFSQAVITQGAAFLLLPRNAYQASIGNSAHVKGINASPYNPAGIAGTSDDSPNALSTSLNYYQLPASVFLTNLSYSHYITPIIGSFGFYVTYLNYGSIPNTDVDGNTNGSIKPYELIATLNYARALPFDILIGINLNYLHQNLANFTSHGFSSDISIKKSFKVAKVDYIDLLVSGGNFGTALKLNVVAIQLPIYINTSLTYTLKNKMPTWMYITFITNYNYYLYNEFLFQAGLDLHFKYKAFETYLLLKYQISHLLDNNSPFAIGTGFIYNFNQAIIDITLNYTLNLTIGHTFAVSLRISNSISKKLFSNVKSTKIKKKLTQDALEVEREIPLEKAIILGKEDVEDENKMEFIELQKKK